MLELLTASAILFIGLTGVVALLIRSSNDARAGVSASNAMGFANSALVELAALRYSNLAGTTGADAGIVFDESGRRYGRTVVVVDAGGTAILWKEVTVLVDWAEANRVNRRTTVSAIITRLPDGG